MTPLVSIVVPVWSDTAALTRLLPQLPPHPDVEVIVAGGGDEGLADALTRRPDIRLIRTSRGRARQMNAGAAAAAGEWLFFLHADSVLPAEWLIALRASAHKAVGGWFRFALDDIAWQARLLERVVAWRVGLFGLPYGDQGLFVRRDVFEGLGGYRELPLMEDVEFVRRLVRAGPMARLPLPLKTSSRRWRQDGWLRRSAVNVCLLSLYFAGVSPHRLAVWYGGGR